MYLRLAPDALGYFDTICRLYSLKLYHLLQILHVLAEQVCCPVDQVKKSKHERKKYSRDNIDTFGTGRKFGKPSFAPVALWQTYVNLASSHFFAMKVSMLPNQRTLKSKKETLDTNIEILHIKILNIQFFGNKFNFDKNQCSS